MAERAGFRLVEIPIFRDDERGDLGFAQFDDHLPFQPLRAFYLMGLRKGVARGEHAHRRDEQFLVCIRGSVTIEVDSGTRREAYRLDHPGVAVYAPPLTWLTIQPDSADSFVLVLAARAYDPGDYVTDYAEFRSLAVAPEGSFSDYSVDYGSEHS